LKQKLIKKNLPPKRKINYDFPCGLSPAKNLKSSFPLPLFGDPSSRARRTAGLGTKSQDARKSKLIRRKRKMNSDIFVAACQKEPKFTFAKDGFKLKI
jgi:hypothetical protein